MPGEAIERGATAPGGGAPGKSVTSSARRQSRTHSPGGAVWATSMVCPPASRPRRRLATARAPGNRGVVSTPTKRAIVLRGGRAEHRAAASTWSSRPSISTPTRSPSAMASPRSWVTSTVVVRSSRRMRPRSSIRPSRVGLIERGERLVEQEQLRLDHEGAGQRRALRLPAGERARPAPGEVRDRRSARATRATRASPRSAPHCRGSAGRGPRCPRPSCRRGAAPGRRSPCVGAPRALAPAATALALEAHRRPPRAPRAAPMHAQQRRLARAVGADDGEDLARRARRARARRARRGRRGRPGCRRARRPARRAPHARERAARGSSRGAWRAASGDRARCRGSRRRGAAPRSRGRSRPARGARARRAGRRASTSCRSPPRRTTRPAIRFMWWPAIAACHGPCG